MTLKLQKPPHLVNRFKEMDTKIRFAFSNVMDCLSNCLLYLKLVTVKDTKIRKLILSKT